MKIKVVILASVMLSVSGLSYAQTPENKKSVDSLLKELVAEYLNQSDSKKSETAAVDMQPKQNAGNADIKVLLQDVLEAIPENKAPQSESASDNALSASDRQTVREIVKSVLGEMEVERIKEEASVKNKSIKELVLEALKESEEGVAENNSVKKAVKITSEENTPANTFAELPKEKHKVFAGEQDEVQKVAFPEGFVMELPVNTYVINRQGGHYTFKFKNHPEQKVDFDVIVTNFNPHDRLKENNHFLVSKNRNLGLYGLYVNNEVTGKRDILGFRLFYTMPIDENTYVTARSVVFDSYEESQEYVEDLLALSTYKNINSVSYAMYNTGLDY
ncbi:MAG: hypothetical protein ACLVKO_09320 [Dysgonomonas sp.]